MRELLARRHFREMDQLQAIIKDYSDVLSAEVVDEVRYKDRSYPLYVISMGSPNPEDPVVGFFGGVHGLEKIGSEVVLSHLTTVAELMRWDESFQIRMKNSRLIFMPIVNPIGIVLRRRSNGNGVDLMRNSPLSGEDRVGPIYRGHRIDPRLPWYRGDSNNMEVEAKALCRVAEEKLFTSRRAFAVDVHSGFGAKDRLWFPFAHSRKPFPLLPEAYALKRLYDKTYSHHFYEIELVSRQYTIHGDLWDYLFLKHQSERKPSEFFIPWTLEMGSWIWIKKNPIQVFSKFGVFHPIKPHRYHRILRRHLTLFDFLHRSLLSPEIWTELTQEQREKNRQEALKLWYDGVEVGENQ